MTRQSRKSSTSTYTAPVYAAVGAADLAVEQLRKTLAQVELLADSIRKDLEERVAKANADAHEAATRAGQAAHDAPEQVLNQGLTVASLASHAYAEMAQRGQRVVGRSVEDIREDKRVKRATGAAESTVKVATETAGQVRGFADKAFGRKDAGAVTVTGSVVPGDQPESAPVKNVRAASTAAKDKPATPRKRTTKRATTAEDVSAEAKPATRRPSRASVTKKAAGTETSAAAARTAAKRPARRTTKATAARTTAGTDPVAASAGNVAATDTAPATGGTASPAVEASVKQAATE